MKRQRVFLLCGILLLTFGGVVAALLDTGSNYAKASPLLQGTQAATALAADSDLMARGKYLVTAIDCAQCHGDPKVILDPQALTKPESVNVPFIGGREFDAGPLGTFYAPNLTGDPDTGLGDWTTDQIVNALRNGVDNQGQTIAPLMPYNYFHGMSDDDAKAIAVYLKTLPPVKNQAPDDKRGPIFGFIKPLTNESIPAPKRDGSAAYGDYLTHHVAFCVDCHSPSNQFRQIPPGHEFAGGNQPVSIGVGFDLYAPPITGTVLNAQGFTKPAFLQTLRTGTVPWGGKLAPIMPWPHYATMSDDDLGAIWEYLQTLKQPTTP